MVVHCHKAEWVHLDFQKHIPQTLCTRAYLSIDPLEVRIFKCSFIFLNFHIFPPFCKTQHFLQFLRQSDVLTHFVLFITITSKPYQSMGLYRVVPQCLNLSLLLATLPMTIEKSSTDAILCVLLDQTLSAKWKSRLVSCR